VKAGIELAGKRVLVVGLARTGIATSLFCARAGAKVTATDERAESEIGATAQNLSSAGVTLALGGHPSQLFLEQDLIVVSPGVPAKIPPLKEARARGIPVWSEIELASRFLNGRMVAITGSNGKTTTTALLDHILKGAGIPTLLGGNIGTPLISHVEVSASSSVAVVEVSSFQLETIENFRPDVGVLLNLTPDHLDRHHSLEEYARAKGRLFENQTERDSAVLNADDPQVAQLVPSRPQVFWFSRQRRVADGAFLRDGQIIFRHEGDESPLLHSDDITLRGSHNVENVMAAAVAARLIGAEPAEIAHGVRTFAGVEHRLEFVARINGVNYFNDSKATNVDATQKALEAFTGPLLVILGGKDKGSDYAVLRDPLKRNTRLALVIGAAAEKITAQLNGAIPVEQAGTIERAVQLAYSFARPGDTVLLAPACASFDQFENYEHRGRVFKQLIQQLVAQTENRGAGLSARKG
jgi:UDP-N-acetylmuramoylalanine--D-glutamate ligase